MIPNDLQFLRKDFQSKVASVEEWSSQYMLNCIQGAHLVHLLFQRNSISALKVFHETSVDEEHCDSF